jgi:two-component system nitrate/nitrite sensor histidine kinase NarX
VRQAISHLQDEPVKPASLQEQLKALVQKFSADSGLVSWETTLPGELRLSIEDTQHVIGIAHESLANALRHASPSHIIIRLSLSEDTTRLEIEDNGCGFDPNAEPAGERKHFGLKILHARAAHLGGSLEVCSEPGKGTRVSLTWPVRKSIVPLPNELEGSHG